MNQAHTTSQQLSAAPDSDEISLMDLMIAMAKNKRVLLALPTAVAIVAVAISLLLPNVYRATTKLMPPQQAQSGAAGLLSQLGGMSGMAAGVAGLKNPNDMYVAMLKSRTIADKLIAKFDLKKVYGVESQEKARKELEDTSSIVASKDGLITIDVEAQDQKLVAKVANSYVAELIELTKVLAVTEASRRRIFYEQQLELAKNNLATAEMTLKSSLDKYGVISVDVESRAIVETIGKLRAQVSAKEIQLRSMEAFVTANNPSYRRTQEELISLRNELAKLENGRGEAVVPNAGSNNKDGLENIKTLRDVKYFQMLYEILAKQYEVARLDEAKDPAIIQVLDPAIDPERKFKPKRTLIVLGSVVAAFFLAVVWVVFSTLKRKTLASPELASRWSEMKQHLGRK